MMELSSFFLWQIWHWFTTPWILDVFGTQVGP